MKSSAGEGKPRRARAPIRGRRTRRGSMMARPRRVRLGKWFMASVWRAGISVSETRVGQYMTLCVFILINFAKSIKYNALPLSKAPRFGLPQLLPGAQVFFTQSPAETNEGRPVRGEAIKNPQVEFVHGSMLPHTVAV